MVLTYEAYITSNVFTVRVFYVVVRVAKLVTISFQLHKDFRDTCHDYPQVLCRYNLQMRTNNCFNPQMY